MSESLRAKLPLTPNSEPHFRWRGHEVSRLESLTDGVFALAVTLLVMSAEVPRTFAGLMDVVRGFPAFVICFTLLMIFWTDHYRFFRRYGIEDGTTRVLTMAILVLVLFSVYPLKFLFALVSTEVLQLPVATTAALSSRAELRGLYLVYGLGFASVWSLYAALYAHALRRQKALELTPGELIWTHCSLRACLIYGGVCLLSIALAYSTRSNMLPGFIYGILGPLHAWNHHHHRKRFEALSTTPQPAASAAPETTKVA